MTRLDLTHASSLLATALPHWRLDHAHGGSITRDFVFTDFVQAFGFMTQVAMLAERCNHHPEWSNVYKRVSITLTTHDVQGLSMKDINLAGLIDQCADGVGNAATSA